MNAHRILQTAGAITGAVIFAALLSTGHLLDGPSDTQARSDTARNVQDAQRAAQRQARFERAASRSPNHTHCQGGPMSGPIEFAGPEPEDDQRDDDDDPPITRRELIGYLMLLAFIVTVWVAGMAAAIGYLTGLFLS